jgi:uncharacterized protein YbjT (DUF2867 family)
MTSNVVVFGPTGTAGSAVVNRCLADDRVGEVRAVTRRPLERRDPRLVEVRCADFADLAPIGDALTGVAGCFFCLGASSTQVRDPDAYRAITVEYAVAAAEALRATSPVHAFHFLSASGVRPDSRMAWARVKAEAERRLADLDLHRLYVYRPGYIAAAPERRPDLGARILAGLLRPFPALLVAADDLARAMLNVQFGDDAETVLDNRAIRRHAAS